MLRGNELLLKTAEDIQNSEAYSGQAWLDESLPKGSQGCAITRMIIFAGGNYIGNGDFVIEDKGIEFWEMGNITNKGDENFWQEFTNFSCFADRQRMVKLLTLLGTDQYDFSKNIKEQLEEIV